MGVNTKSENLKMSANSPAGGKKRKSCSGVWNIDEKDIPGSGKKLKKAFGKQQGFNEEISQNEIQNKSSPRKIKGEEANISSRKLKKSKKQNSEAIKREYIDSGGPSQKLQKFEKDLSGIEPTPKKKKPKPAAANVPGVKKHKFTVQNSSPPERETKRIQHVHPASHTTARPSGTREENTPALVTPHVNAFPGWNAGDLFKLLERIEEKSSQLLSLKISDAKDKINWENISFGPFTAESCRATWMKLQLKSRSPRELINEVRKMLLSKFPAHTLLPKGDVMSAQSKSKAKEIADDDEEEQEDEDDDEDEQEDEDDDEDEQEDKDDEDEQEDKDDEDEQEDKDDEDDEDEEEDSEDEDE